MPQVANQYTQVSQDEGNIKYLVVFLQLYIPVEDWLFLWTQRGQGRGGCGGDTGHGFPVLGLPKLPGMPGPGSLKPAAGSCPTVSEDPLFLPASLPYSRNHSETSIPKKMSDRIPGKSIWQKEG